MKPVVVVIDMQNDFFKKERLLEQKDSLVKNINDLTTLAREHNVPVIWIRQVLKVDLSNSPKHVRELGKGEVLEGTEGSKLLSGLEKKARHYEVIKTRYSGFFKTNLDDLLDKLKVDTLIISGINTHACIRMTVIDAYQRDRDVIIAKDCVGSWDDEHHRVTMKYFEPVIAKVKTNDKIKNMLLD